MGDTRWVRYPSNHSMKEDDCTINMWFLETRPLKRPSQVLTVMFFVFFFTVAGPNYWRCLFTQSRFTLHLTIIGILEKKKTCASSIHTSVVSHCFQSAEFIVFRLSWYQTPCKVYSVYWLWLDIIVKITIFTTHENLTFQKWEVFKDTD